MSLWENIGAPPPTAEKTFVIALAGGRTHAVDVRGSGSTRLETLCGRWAPSVSARQVSWSYVDCERCLRRRKEVVGE